MRDWSAVWRAIDERRIALGWSKADLYRHTSTSERTFQKMSQGEPVVREAKRRQITNALGWTPDSIASILDGGNAQLDETPTDRYLRANPGTVASDELLAFIQARPPSTFDEARRLGREWAEMNPPPIDALDYRLAALEDVVRQQGDQLAALAALVRRLAVEQLDDDVEPTGDATRPGRASD